jgi:hypothetical protein
MVTHYRCSAREGQWLLVVATQVLLSYYDLQADRVLATAERSRKMNIATDSRDIH